MGVEQVAIVLLVLIALTPLWVVLIRKENLDLLEPVFTFVAAFSIFMVVRPLYIVLADDYIFINSFLGGGEQWFVPAISTAGFGMICFFLGYYLLARRTKRVVSRQSEILEPKPIILYGVILAGVGLALYVAGGAGATSGYGGADSTAYLYLGIDLAGVGLFIALVGSFQSTSIVARLLSLVAVIAMLMYYSTLMARYRAFYLMVSVGLYLAIRFFGKLGFTQAIIVAGIALTYHASVGFLRSGKSELSIEDTERLSTSEVVSRYFSSDGDLHIFDIFTRIMRDVPEVLPYQGGATYAKILVHPLPRLLWPEKPYPTEYVVNQTLYAGTGPVLIGSGYSYSMAGSFYVEGGILGVALGFLFFGALCRSVFEVYRRRKDLTSLMVMCCLLPGIVFTQRCGITSNDTVWILCYILPVVAMGRVCSRRAIFGRLCAA